MSSSKPQQDFLMGALIGGVVGAAAALFLTPIKGEKLRNEITNGFGYLNPEQLFKPARKRKAAASAKRAVKKVVAEGKAVAKKVVANAKSAKKAVVRKARAVKVTATKGKKTVKKTAAKLSVTKKAPRKKRAPKEVAKHAADHGHGHTPHHS